MKAVFDKLETPDHKPLLSIVMPAKDGLLSELGGYIQNRRISYETAKGERTEEPPPPRGETPKPAKALDQAIRLVGFSVLMVNQEKIGGVLAVQFTSPDLAKFVVGGLDAVVEQPRRPTSAGQSNGRRSDDLQPDGPQYAKRAGVASAAAAVYAAGIHGASSRYTEALLTASRFAAGVRRSFPRRKFVRLSWSRRFFVPRRVKYAGRLRGAARRFCAQRRED